MCLFELLPHIHFCDWFLLVLWNSFFCCQKCSFYEYSWWWLLFVVNVKFSCLPKAQKMNKCGQLAWQNLTHKTIANNRLSSSQSVWVCWNFYLSTQTYVPHYPIILLFLSFTPLSFHSMRPKKKVLHSIEFVECMHDIFYWAVEIKGRSLKWEELMYVHK